MEAIAYMSIMIMLNVEPDLPYTKPQGKAIVTRPDTHLSNSRYLSSGGSGRLGSLLSGVGSITLSSIDVIVLLSGRVDRDLNGNLTALNLFAVHLVTSLLLELLRAEGNETKTAALAGLTTSLQLLDHEAGDGAESDLGLGRRVVLEDLKELDLLVQPLEVNIASTYLVLLQVVGQVGNHDLGLGGNAILGGTTLLALARFAWLTRFTGGCVLLGLVVALLGCKRFVRRLGKRSDLAGYICRGGVGGRGVGELDLVGTLSAFSLLVHYD
jgi:hypothetical protein